MNLRKILRDSARRGNYAFGIVETVSLGLATVRLSQSSQRVTNLTVIGDNVIPGDTVLVDFSANKPTVRKYSQPLSADQISLEEASASSPAAVIEGTNKEDVGVHVGPHTEWAYNEDFLGIPNGVPTLMTWIYDDPYFGHYYSTYDTSDHIPGTGADFIEIKRTGRYLLILEGGFRHEGLFLNYISRGYLKISAVKNYSETIATAQGYPYGNTLWSNRYAIENVTQIVELREGDFVSIEVFQNLDNINPITNESGYSKPPGYFVAQTLIHEHEYGAARSGFQLSLQLLPGEVTGDCLAEHGWITPTDISYEEALALCQLYHMLDGDNWPEPPGWTGQVKWGTSETAEDWYGLYFTGGVLTDVGVYFDEDYSPTGDITEWDPSPLINMTYFEIYDAPTSRVTGITADISGWVWPDGITDIQLQIDADSGGGITVDFNTFNWPSSLEDFLLWGWTNTMSGLPPTSLVLDHWYRIEVYEVQAPYSGYADDWVQYLYENWGNFNGDFSRMNFYLTDINDTLSGVYQNASPPTTGHEYEYKLENDPDATGNKLFFIGVFDY